MRDTSLEAYESVPLQKNEKLVLEAIKKNQPCDNLKIATELNWQINRVTGRVNGLVKKGIVTDYDKAKNANGRSAIRWVCSDMQLGLF